jgi:Trypsin-like peptidase domain/TPR repeat
MTKQLSHSLFLFFMVFLTVPLRADSIREVVARAKQTVVEILTANAAGTQKALGAGFFVSADGLVVTNQHVIEGASSITAINNNGAIFLFQRVVAQPIGVDLVVLKFHATDVPFLKLGESTTAVEGQKVIVIGNPTDLMRTVSDGIISAFREHRSLIQITAPISPGSSGSPVIDENGQVIGVATLQSVEGQNLNFAIPVENVSAALIKTPNEQIADSALPMPTPILAIDATTPFDTGNALLDKKEYDKAISAFTDAIQLDPSFARAYYGRGLAFAGQGKLYEAISDYNKAIRLNPNFAAAFNNRGNVFADQDKLNEAIDDYNEAIRLDPNYATAYRNRGLTYLRAGNPSKADADFATERRLKAGQ